jgi:hypothetical protein
LRGIKNNYPNFQAITNKNLFILLNLGEEMVDYYTVTIEYFNSITANIYGNLALYTVGLGISMLLIWYLYRKIARRSMFTFEKKEYDGGIMGAIKGMSSFLFFMIKYGLLYPIYTFIMFLILATSIFFLSTGTTIPNVMFISIIIISVIRLLAYVKEDAAQELSKMLPFALIAFFLTNTDKVTTQYVFPNLGEVATSLPLLGKYAIFLIGLELGLMILYFFISKIVSRDDED